jgi:hypothetical protein
MRRFQALNTYAIEGRTVKTIILDRDEPREWLLQKLQEEGGVIIDGEHYQVDSIESFATPMLRRGTEIGLRLVTYEDRNE